MQNDFYKRRKEIPYNVFRQTFCRERQAVCIPFTDEKETIIGGKMNMEILKVSAKSNPNSVAGALAGVMR